MSPRFDFERLSQTFVEIPQTASAKSVEQSEIQQTMSVESLAPSLIGAAPSLTKELADQLARVPREIREPESGSHE